MSQFGFPKGKNTHEALIQLTKYLYNGLNFKSNYIVKFIDFQKAFDTGNHHILLQKLEKYGIRGYTLKLFRIYIENRTQAIRYKKINL